MQRTDRNGRVIDYGYDALGRRTSETWDDGRVLSFSYDAAGQLTSASDPAATLTYTWDTLGRATSETHSIAGLGSDVVLSRAYDAVGNRWQLAAAVGDNSDLVTTTEFDAVDRPATIELSGIGVLPKRIELTYDAVNQITSLKRFEGRTSPHRRGLRR